MKIQKKTRLLFQIKKYKVILILKFQLQKKSLLGAAKKF